MWKSSPTIETSVLRLGGSTAADWKQKAQIKARWRRCFVMEADRAKILTDSQAMRHSGVQQVRQEKKPLVQRKKPPRCGRP
jgi:hypothetical protein